MTSLFKLLEKNDIDIEMFLVSEGIDPKQRRSPDSRISLTQMHHITNKAAVLMGDSHLGLHQGEVYSGLPSILCYVMMNCHDLAEALEKCRTYQRITDETKRLDIIYEGDTAVLCATIVNDAFDTDTHLSDAMLCGLFMFFKFLTGKKISLKEIRFRHAALKEISEYTRIFQCPVKFDSQTNAIVMDKKVLNTRLLHPNHELLALFEKQAAEVLRRQLSTESYSGRISHMMIQFFREAHSPSLETIAKRMATSVRKLQMKLKEESTTYRELLNTTRKNLAMEYLKDTDVSICEISYLLGFSEPSTFHRFFKKLTGHTPLKYRENLISFKN
jgi:AraC-like DNA-binding protein